MDGLGALQEVAPAQAQALSDIESVMWRDAAAAGLTETLALAAQVCAGQLGLEPLQVAGQLVDLGRQAVLGLGVLDGVGRLGRVTE